MLAYYFVNGETISNCVGFWMQLHFLALVSFLMLNVCHKLYFVGV